MLSILMVVLFLINKVIRLNPTMTMKISITRSRSYLKKALNNMK